MLEDGRVGFIDFGEKRRAGPVAQHLLVLLPAVSHWLLTGKHALRQALWVESIQSSGKHSGQPWWQQPVAITTC